MEDSWWPHSVTASRPFTLPPSSRWLQRQDGSILIIQTAGDQMEYHTHPNHIPFLMLLDITQLAYLLVSNTGNANQQQLFYQGVVFLDFLRGEFLSAIRKSPNTDDLEAQASSVPECMHRWLCRLLHRIPHDPKSRRHHAQFLDKVYLELDVFKYGTPKFLFLFLFSITCYGGDTDFLGWSFKNEEEIVSCLTALTSNSAVDGASLYHPADQSPFRWLEILRSQFVQVRLCTDGSVSRIEDQPKPERESMKAGGEEEMNKEQELVPGKEGIQSRSDRIYLLVPSLNGHHFKQG